MMARRNSDTRDRTIRSVRLRHHQGVVQADRQAHWSRQWREPYRFMLAIPWPGFLLAIAGSYLLLNVGFAALVSLDLQGIGGLPDGRAATVVDAFFFSVQTLGSIGYGVLHPTSLWVNLVVTLESLCGLLFIAITTGLAFSRFSKSRARLRFSDVATIEPAEGGSILTFRVANVRQNSLVDGRIRVSLSMDEETPEANLVRRVVPLSLVRDQSITFQLMWTVMHRIDATSPLHGLTLEQLRRRRAELLVAFQGIDEVLLVPVHFRISFGTDDLRMNERFVDMVRMDGPDSVCLDFRRFDQTEPVVADAGI